MNRIVPILILFFIIIACGRKEHKPAPAPPAEALKNIEVAAVTTGSLQDKMIVYGAIEPFLTVTVSAEEGGRLDEIFFDKGGMIREGDTIAYIDREMLLAQIRQAETQNQMAENRFRRAEQLVAKQAISRQTFDDARYSYEAGLDAIRILNLKMNKTAPRSPVAGEVVEKFVEEGELVTPGSPLLKVQQNNVVKVVFGIPEAVVTSVNFEDLVNIECDALPGFLAAGAINYISPEIDPLTKSYRAEVILDNSNAKLKPGLVCRVEIIRKSYAATVIVPRSAVLKIDEDFAVYTVEQGIVRLKRVTLGPIDGDRQIVVAGLKAGELLIVKGHRDVVDGEKVNAFKTGSADTMPIKNP